jgi:hypothetical protein
MKTSLKKPSSIYSINKTVISYLNLITVLEASNVKIIINK